MSRIGILAHAHQNEARELASKVEAWLREQGHEPVADPSDPGGLELLVVLGGDGTVLHGIDHAGFAGVPILGVNLGRLGFLTEVGPDGVFDAIADVLAGKATIDERSTVAAEIVRPGNRVESVGEAANEVSVERRVGGKVIRMAVTIGGQRFTTYAADGLIVATPTGSTAYAFSMHGPVVAPQLRCLVVVAAAPHGLFDRPLVVADDQTVEVTVQFGGRGIVLMDGNERSEIGEGDVLRARVGPSTVRLVRLGPDSFFTRVARRFGIERSGS